MLKQLKTITDSDVFNIIKVQAKSTWNSIDDKKLEEISKIIGTNLEAQKPTESNPSIIWKIVDFIMDFISPFIKNKTLKYMFKKIDKIVEMKGVGISNEDIKDSLIEFAKSSFNSLDSDKINKIMAVVNKK